MYTFLSAWYKLLMREPDTEVIDNFLGMSSRTNGPACNFVSNSCSQTEAICGLQLPFQMTHSHLPLQHTWNSQACEKSATLLIDSRFWPEEVVDMLQATRSTAASSKNAVIACSKEHVACKSHSCTENETGVLRFWVRHRDQ